MEKRPYHAEFEPPVQAAAKTTAAASTDWRSGLPPLRGRTVSLRELRPSDAPSLFAMLTAGEVTRFISPPPSTVEGFERFIAWAIRRRLAGASACFAVALESTDIAIGAFQLRELEPGFGTAEWGFAIGSPYWGTGTFQEGADLMAKFAFDVVGVNRLEARAAVRNGRGNGALRKFGAVQEGVLRKSFLKNGEYIDQVLWTILKEEWRQAKVVWTERLH
jgi:ribosomal-protein-alanine N-acetyltransferase